MSTHCPSPPATMRRAVRDQLRFSRRLLGATAVLALAVPACGDTGDDSNGVGAPVNTGPVTSAPGTNPIAMPGGPTQQEQVAPGVPPAGTDMPNGTPTDTNVTPPPTTVAPGATTTTPDPTPNPDNPTPNVPSPTDPDSTPVNPGVSPVTPGDTPANPGETPANPGEVPGPDGSGNCTFDVNYELSSAIGTVGIVTWSADIAVESASIEFGLAGEEPHLSAPVDLEEADYRTLLLGMKGSTDYEFHIVANGGGQTCTSETFSLTTEPVPNNGVPRVNAMKNDEGAASKGFIVTSAGLGMGGFGGGGGGGGAPMFIFDTDGEVVWWADAPGNASRARMDWEGKNMYVMALNYPESGGQMRRVSMDGLDVEGNLDGLSSAHHDFTVAPNGVVTTILWEGGCNSIVERSPDGSIKTIVQTVETLYQPGGGLGGGFECHGNAITYQPESDSYVLSDRNPNLFVKFDREGNLLWQFGGNGALGMHLPGSWNVNHGHHLLPDGTFIFFNNESGNPSPVREYALDENGGSATLLWEYSGNQGSATLGDVQRLPNGNTIITYSNTGTIVEVDAAKNVLQTFTTDSLGYAVFRESLYGAPPK